MKKFIFNIIFIFSISIHVNAQDRFDQYINWLTSNHKYDSISTQQKGTYTFSEEPDCPDYYNWALVWEDNFNGTSLNEFYWEKADGAPCNITDIYYSPNNVVVENGYLKLYENNNFIVSAPVTSCNPPWTSTSHPFYNTSALIKTKQKFLYGKFEIKCKMPSGRGHRPAFWLHDGNSEGPDYREIDVFEFWNQFSNGGDFIPSLTNKVHHMAVYNTIFSNKKEYEDNNNTIDYSIIDHVFSLEWDPFTIKWYVDGNLKETHYRYKLGVFNIGFINTSCNNIITGIPYIVNSIYPTQPMKVIINTRVDNGDPNYLPTTFPAVMEVDWIKIYERINPEEVVNVCFLNLNNNTYEYSVITGNQITIGGSSCNATIHGWADGESLSLVACNRIDLNPGFKVESGGRFSASIVPCDGSGMKNSDFPLSSDIKISNISNKSSDSTILFNVYPNPSNGTFKISFLETFTEFNGLAILNSMGSIVFKTNEIQNNDIIVDISNYPNGIYYLTFMINNQAFAHKLIKQ